MNQLLRPASPRKPSLPREFLKSGELNPKYDKQREQYCRALVKYEQALHEFKLLLNDYHLKLKQKQFEIDNIRFNRLTRQERDIEVKLHRVQKQLIEEINLDTESFCSASADRIF